MYQRTEYEMTEDDLKAILAACKPVPVMMIGDSVAHRSPQENANRAWARLGEKMGFDHMTVRPVQGKGQRFFSAVPSETAEARAEREMREAEEQRQRDIARLKEEIAERQARLVDLQ
jgi:hypothetical protein